MSVSVGGRRVQELEAAVPAVRRRMMQQQLEEARTEAHEAAQCAVCRERGRDTFLNCGHIICQACASRIATCPICRAAITHRSRAFV